MPENNQSQPTVIACPSCSGRGKFGVRPCPACQGRGLYVWSNGRLLYWSKEFNRKDLWQNQINKITNAIFASILLLITLWGFYSLAAFLLESIQIGLFSLDVIFTKDSRLLIFYVSLWVDLYLYCRLSKSTLEGGQTLDLINKSLTPPYSPLITPNSPWSDVLSVPKKNRLDISRFFSPEAHEAILKSWEAAKKLNHREVDPLHLLAASLSFEKTAIIFGRLGIPLHNLKDKIGAAISSLLSDVRAFTEPEISIELKKTFFLAFTLAAAKRKKQVDLFDLLIALNNLQSPAREVLYELEIEKEELENVVIWVETAHELQKSLRRFSFLSMFKPHSGMNRAMTAIATPILDRLSADLTLLARNGYLSPCVGRDEELEQIFSVAESSKPGVLLVGYPGVGKSAVVNGIARRMVTEKVPKILEDKRLVNLSVAALVSGASTSGAAEQRVTALLNEIIRSGNIALSITDVHNMIGAKTTQGELDLTEILASAASHGRFFIIATTNPIDYHRYIENTALDEILEKVKIAEPKGNQAIQILEVASLPIEAKHQVFFSYDAIAAAATLSDRYLHERYLPEKAISLLETAAVSIRKTRGKNIIIQKQDIAQVISNQTQIPLTQITEVESAKLLHLEERIHEKMVDQDPAVKAIANALRRARAELRDTGRPIANFLFLGPTGVGKTQLAKVVAEVYFGSAKNMIRLDMSEYQEQNSVERLIGVTGSQAGGLLTEAIRQNPFSLLLLDELEKAHPEVLNLFLQVMDDGRLTDGLGRTIDFTSAIIIATSNAGAQYIKDSLHQAVAYETIKRNLIENELKNNYRPEFLNRLDEVIVFKPLSPEDISQITIILLAEVVKQMETKGIKLEFTEESVLELAKLGFDPEFGARPLRRVIQEKVTNILAQYLIQGDVTRRDTILYDIGGKITVKKAKHL